MKNVNKYPFKNVPLPYSYDFLEPFIDTKTMQLHHDRHLQTYVDNLNKALSNYPMYWDWSLQRLIVNSNKLPKEIRTEVVNNAGGVYNHVFYFNELTNNQNKYPIGMLKDKISSKFGNYDKFKELFKKEALSVFGSGYAWLALDENDNLVITKTANQDTTLTQNLIPILNIDVWEHAYYLKHYNKRADYINDWFNVINWNLANQRLEKATEINSRI